MLPSYLRTAHTTLSPWKSAAMYGWTRTRGSSRSDSCFGQPYSFEHGSWRNIECDILADMIWVCCIPQRNSVLPLTSAISWCRIARNGTELTSENCDSVTKFLNQLSVSQHVRISVKLSATVWIKANSRIWMDGMKSLRYIWAAHLSCQSFRTYQYHEKSHVPETASCIWGVHDLFSVGLQLDHQNSKQILEG